MCIISGRDYNGHKVLLRGILTRMLPGKNYYDRKYHCMEIIPGDIVLVHQKVFESVHKIADQWEIPVYKVLEKHGDRPVFMVQRIGPGVIEYSEPPVKSWHQP